MCKAQNLLRLTTKYYAVCVRAFTVRRPAKIEAMTSAVCRRIFIAALTEVRGLHNLSRKTAVN